MSDESVILLGCKHCGKTTQGRAVAGRLGVPFFDTDAVIEKASGKSVRAFYIERGVSEFMRAEEAVCRKIATQNERNTVVVATGGGICDNPPALAELRPLGKFVFLRLDLEFSVSRIVAKAKKNDDGSFSNLPGYVLEKEPSSLKEIHDILLKKYQERFRIYNAIADIVIDLKDAPKEQNFAEICRALDL